MPPIVDASTRSLRITSLPNWAFSDLVSFVLSASLKETAVVTWASTIPLYSSTSFSNFSQIETNTDSRLFFVIKETKPSKEEQDAFKYEALKYYKYIEAKKCDDFIFENRDFDD